ncbi:MAG: hypothetical protein CMJ83_16370 [Planctomycetes bacterium]|nr:hypothetical protein [Planctomycetota bacterium]
MRITWSLVLVALMSVLICGQGLLYTYDGLVGGDSLGISVRDIGDVDQDGFGDYITGAFFADTVNGVDSGAAYVYSGQTGALLYSIPGAAAGDRFGVAVAGGADVTGDGVDDFAVGASRSDLGGLDSGLVAVYSGATGNLARVLVGSTGFNLGESVSLGDLDGDGFAEIACCSFTQTYVGRAFVYNGIDGSLRFQLFAPGVTSGGQANWGFGIDVVGDVDADGYGDLCVVGYSTGNGVTPSTIFSGFDGSIIRVLSYQGFDPYRAVAGAGDLDSDGTPDLVIAKPGNGSIFGGGSASTSLGAISGANGALIWTAQSDAAWGYWPIWVDGIGDLNGDGINDVLAGSGNASIGGGFYKGSFQAFSGSNGGLIMAVYGETAQSYFGARVSAAGDVNGDGVEDIIVGAYGQGGATGRVQVYSGWYVNSAWACSIAKGIGCGGAATAPLLTATRPVLGTASTIRIQRGPTAAVAALVIDASWPAPWAFNPACIAHVDLANLNNWLWLPIGNVAGGGVLSFVLGVPNQPGLAGFPVTFQAVFASPGPAYALSNGVYVQIGF